MKRRLQIIIRASSASLLAFAALAQQPATSRPGSPEYSRDRADTSPSVNRIAGAAKASDLIGMDVRNRQNEKLGKIEELAVDMESGRVVQAIVATGGFIGIGESLTAVPPGALRYDDTLKVVHLDATKETLQSAPKFENSKWAEYSDASHVAATYRHFDQEQAYNFVQAEGSGRTTTTGQRVTSPRGTNDAQRNRDMAGTRQPDGTWTPGRDASQSQYLIPAARLGQVEKASKLTGKAVKNLQDEKIGDIKDLVVDLQSGRVLAVIVETGDYLGMDDQLSAVPPSAFRFAPDRETLQLSVTKEQLSQAPHFKPNQWPDFNQPSYAGGIYRAYRIEPYFSTDASDDTRRNVRDRDYRTSGTNAPNNSGRNIRDRDNQTVTPFDQGTSQADVAMTAQIRNEIINARGLSLNARNVKIITNEGRVILRGPVNTEEEKRIIGEIATRIAPAGRVENQLEVKPGTTGNN
jgi:sporulation protein YlmC with PRC-barrel domain